MAFEDRALTCRECGGSFLFTASEQEFYAAKGFENEPTRCPDCRSARRGSSRRGGREMTEIACAACGIVTDVPFKPTGTKPVYCRDCYGARN